MNRRKHITITLTIAQAEAVRDALGIACIDAQERKNGTYGPWANKREANAGEMAEQKLSEALNAAHEKGIRGW